MFGKIVYMNNNVAHIKVEGGLDKTSNLMNMHVIFEDKTNKFVGEVEDVSEDVIKVIFLGEFIDNKFVGGIIRKPPLSSSLRLINDNELDLILSSGQNSFELGISPLYNNHPITVNINALFGHHMAIFGNSGSGKSCSFASMLQSVFKAPNILPYNANFLVFDTYGEYRSAFKDINKYNPNLNFKVYTTNKKENFELLRIPLWLLNVDDMALLLSATEHSQLPIIERMLKIVSIFSQSDEKAEDYKNHLLAKAIMSVLYTNQPAAAKRNDIFSLISTCSTSKFNLEAPVQGIGYVRKFRECFLIDREGNFTESNLLTSYVSDFIKDDLDKYEPGQTSFYTLKDLEKALDYTLISEGLLQNEKAYSSAITLKVKLHSLVIGEYADYFAYDKYITLDGFMSSLVNFNGRKAQIIDFNLEDVDDWFGRVITKIFSHLTFDFVKKLPNRASIPFHIFLEEAHRYVRNDNDSNLIGYNIFERIAKEGRKFGIILNLISQRPVEISETVVSQCSNFLIFRINHPRDIDYIKRMLPNINAEIVEKPKSFHPGVCVAFGSAFKVPAIVKISMPSPAPGSSDCDVFARWNVNR